MSCSSTIFIFFIRINDLFCGNMITKLIFFRFAYIAICSLALLHRLDKINVEKAVKYIVSCKNLDGGFGCTPGGESHAGQSMFHVLRCYMYLWIVSNH